MEDLSSSNSTSPKNVLTLALLSTECNITGRRRTRTFSRFCGSNIFPRKNKSWNGAGFIGNQLKIGLEKLEHRTKHSRGGFDILCC